MGTGKESQNGSLSELTTTAAATATEKVGEIIIGGAFFLHTGFGSRSRSRSRSWSRSRWRWRGTDWGWRRRSSGCWADAAHRSCLVRRGGAGGGQRVEKTKEVVNRLLWSGGGRGCGCGGFGNGRPGGCSSRGSGRLGYEKIEVLRNYDKWKFNYMMGLVQVFIRYENANRIC